jgi:hypothetical protein
MRFAFVCNGGNGGGGGDVVRQQLVIFPFLTDV